MSEENKWWILTFVISLLVIMIGILLSLYFTIQQSFNLGYSLPAAIVTILYSLIFTGSKRGYFVEKRLKGVEVTSKQFLRYLFFLIAVPLLMALFLPQFIFYAPRSEKQQLVWVDTKGMALKEMEQGRLHFKWLTHKLVVVDDSSKKIKVEFHSVVYHNNLGKRQQIAKVTISHVPQEKMAIGRKVPAILTQRIKEEERIYERMLEIFEENSQTMARRKSLHEMARQLMKEFPDIRDVTINIPGHPTLLVL